MDSKIRSGDLLLALLCAAISTPLIWGATGLQPRWWLLWIALLPLLWYAGRGRARGLSLLAAAAAFVAWSVGSLNTWSYLRTLIQLPLNVILPICFIPSLFVALAVLLWRRLLHRGRHPSAQQ